MTSSFLDRLQDMQSSIHHATFNEFTRGIERETLRISDNGQLSTRPHNIALGSALAHDNITTDYAEALLEFITPAISDANTTLAQLRDIHRYAARHINGELMWPNSMPCYVGAEEDIELANFGQSNIGKMKRLYRTGLRNRYGSIMQIIAGVHFNLSMPVKFWDWYQNYEKNELDRQDFISEKYFALIRNYKRFCWIIPYLFGASPALCASFLDKTDTELKFESTPNGMRYLPFATSLRMSDLGYTNSNQSDLNISYNSLREYCQGLWRAISTSSPLYEALGVKVDGEYRQLNTNILQIENEFYSAIRPKRVTLPLEKPTQALCRRGVEYVEVRALDVNPFSSVGIDLQQIYFLDIFLTYCALLPSDFIGPEQQKLCDQNLNDVVLRGRDPDLLLHDYQQPINIRQWLTALFADMQQLAKVMTSHSTVDYTAVLATEQEKIDDDRKTFSGRCLSELLNAKPLESIGLARARGYAHFFQESDYEVYDESYFVSQAVNSIEKQRQIEADDKVDFDQFLVDYFSSGNGCD